MRSSSAKNCMDSSVGSGVSCRWDRLLLTRSIRPWTSRRGRGMARGLTVRSAAACRSTISTSGITCTSSRPPRRTPVWSPCIVWRFPAIPWCTHMERLASVHGGGIWLRCTSRLSLADIVHHQTLSWCRSRCQCGIAPRVHRGTLLFPSRRIESASPSSGRLNCIVCAHSPSNRPSSLGS